MARLFNNFALHPARWIGALVAALLLGACTVPFQPNRFDPWQGLLPPNTVAPTPTLETIQGTNRSVGIVVSNSTETQLNYVNSYLKAARQNPLNRFDQSVELIRPDAIADFIVDKFKGRFSRVELVDDFRQAERMNLDVMALVDLEVRYPDNYVHLYRYSIDTFFIDREFRASLKIHGEHQEYNGCTFESSACPTQTGIRVMNVALKQYLADFERRVR